MPIGNPSETPKRFFKQVLKRGPYYEVYHLLETNPDLSISGRVVSDNHHHVHERSTAVRMEAEGYVGEGDERIGVPDKVHDVVNTLRAYTEDDVVAWNRQLTRDLYAALEDQQSDETLIEWFNSNERRFDEEGHEIDLTKYLNVANLQPGIRDKVLRNYADLFDRAPEEVYTALMKRDCRFDKRGNRFDVSQLKRIDQLEPAVRKRILDANRNILVEGDDFWAEDVKEDWEEKLTAMGFDRIQIRYSLGYSQGDGASFTADSIDVRKLCQVRIAQEQKIESAQQLATSLLA